MHIYIYIYMYRYLHIYIYIHVCIYIHADIQIYDLGWIVGMHDFCLDQFHGDTSADNENWWDTEATRTKVNQPFQGTTTVRILWNWRYAMVRRIQLSIVLRPGQLGIDYKPNDRSRLTRLANLLPDMEVSENGVPKIFIFNRIFPYKPSTVGYPHSGTPIYAYEVGWITK